jgi:hypothetical protein
MVFREGLYCSFNSALGQQIGLSGRTLFPHHQFRIDENKGLRPFSGKNLIVRKQLLCCDSKIKLRTAK